MADGLDVLFRAAAGPRLGFGHLVRCRSLARALGVPPRVSLRASCRARAAADRLGVQIVAHGASVAGNGRSPHLIVVDEPSRAHAEAWVNRARRLGVPVAAIHDLGLGYVRSDIGIDASFRPHRGMRGSFGDLRGPAYAVLDPSIVRWRERRSRTVESRRILLALGGGTYVFAMAARLTEAIAELCPDARLRVATGFADVTRLPSLPHGHWVTACQGLGEELARAEVAVLAGGVTLAEACAIGTPVVALAVTPAQRLTIRAAADAGAAIDSGSAAFERAPRRVAAHVAFLLDDARARRRLHCTGRALVDGRGAFRVADRLRALVRAHACRLTEVSDAA